jgi:hypothetical protein
MNNLHLQTFLVVEFAIIAIAIIGAFLFAEVLRRKEDRLACKLRLIKQEQMSEEKVSIEDVYMAAMHTNNVILLSKVLIYIRNVIAISFLFTIVISAFDHDLTKLKRMFLGIILAIIFPIINYTFHKFADRFSDDKKYNSGKKKYEK